MLAAARGLVVVDEAYAEFSSWSALDRVVDDGRLVVVRTFSKTWSMAAARLGYAVAPSWVVDQLDKVVLPYHLDAAKQLAGTLAVRHVDDMERRVSSLVEERGRVAAELADLSRRRRGVPVGRQLHPRALPPSRRPRACGDACSMRASSFATAAAGRGSTAACASRSGCRPRTTASSPRCAARSLSRPARGDDRASWHEDGDAPSARRRRRSVEVTVDLDGTGRTDVSTGIPFYDHMLDQLGRHGGFDLTVARRRATCTSTRTTPSRTSPSPSARRSPRRSATRPACAVSPAACIPLDEALVEVALDLSGRPFVAWDVPLPESLPLGSPAVRPAARRARRVVVRHERGDHAARQRCARAATCTTSSRRRSKGWPAACATPCASRRGRGCAVHQGAVIRVSDERQRRLRGRTQLRSATSGLRDRGRNERALVIAVVDYGIGNLHSAHKALSRLGADARLTDDPAMIGAADARRPARGRGVRRLHGGAAGAPVSKRPCSTPPARAGRSSGSASACRCCSTPARRAPASPVSASSRASSAGSRPTVKRPQMQWNVARTCVTDEPLFAGLGPSRGSTSSTRCTAFPTIPHGDRDRATTAATLNAAFRAGHVSAVQFHPEKSAERRPRPARQLRRRVAAARSAHARDGPAVPVDRPARADASCACARATTRERPPTTHDPVDVAESFLRWRRRVDPRRRPRRGEERA